MFEWQKSYLKGDRFGVRVSVKFHGHFSELINAELWFISTRGDEILSIGSEFRLKGGFGKFQILN